MSSRKRLNLTKDRRLREVKTVRKTSPLLDQAADAWVRHQKHKCKQPTYRNAGNYRYYSQNKREFGGVLTGVGDLEDLKPFEDKVNAEEDADERNHDHRVYLLLGFVGKLLGLPEEEILAEFFKRAVSRRGRNLGNAR